MSDRASIPSLAAVAALRSHPRFHMAAREFVRNVIELYRADRLLNALMSDRTRALFTHAALYLHYLRTRDGEPGLTVGAMKDLCVELKLCSRGRCEAMLALMRAAGLFAAAPNLDRRRRPLVPTEKLFALHRERWTAHLRPMRYVIPEAESWLASLDDPSFVRAFAVALSERFVAGMRIIVHAPLLESFIERNAGLMVLFSLVLSGPADGPFPPTGPVGLSINALASKFSVSRKHVLTQLRDAEELGLLVRGGPANNEVVFLPPGREALENFLGTMFLYFAQSAEEASRASARTVLPAIALAR
jgi:hypothetical protein